MIRKLYSILLNVLDHKSRFSDLKFNKQKPILILGDGISAVHCSDYFKKYNFIISSNKSILNKNLENQNLKYWVCMEPFFNFPKFISKFFNKRLHYSNIIAKNIFSKFSNNDPIFVMNSICRLSLDNYWLKKKIYFVNPKKRIKLINGDIYDDFSGSFQTSLGIALEIGFKNIHLAGFDAWLLNPKNNLRWYSKAPSPELYDYHSIEKIPKFISIANRNSRLKVYTYQKYISKYKFISEIKINNKIRYIPQRDRKKFMTQSNLIFWKNFEKKFFPSGYSKHKTVK